MENFWNSYYRKPLNKIPWQNTQADWFKALVDSGAIAGKTALDLGCGTGKKSVYLAQHGFEQITGVDISPKAIDYAKANAEAAGVVNECRFICHDLTDWTFLPAGELFDFILDWATIHTIPREMLPDYCANISRHCRPDGKLLIRSFFSPDPNEQRFNEETDGHRMEISLLSENELLPLFFGFRKIESQISRPRTQTRYFFTELLLQKR